MTTNPAKDADADADAGADAEGATRGAPAPTNESGAHGQPARPRAIIREPPAPPLALIAL
jgi:hypothetical protein